MMSLLQLFIILIFSAFIIIFIGFLILFAKTLSEQRRKEGEKRVEGGAVIIVGPIPFVFGTSTEVTKILMILAIALTIVAVVAFILLNYVTINPFLAWR